MSRLFDEDLMPLSRAARKYPGGGKHVSQLHRYRQDKNRPALEALKVGGTWMTSEAAMRRHVIALTEAANGATDHGIDAGEIDRLSREADQELAAAGF